MDFLRMGHHKAMRKILPMIVLLGAACSAAAQSYPSRAVKFVVPFPPGALPDQIARVLGRELQESLGQPFVIENRPGAIGVIGTAEAARAAPDGYTIVMTTNSTMAAATSLFKKLQYDPQRDFTPIALVSTTSMILLVRPDFPAQTLKDFISYARAQNGKLTAGYGSAGSQVSIAKLKAGGGFTAIDVPYKGVPLAVTDVLSGQISFTFADFAVGLAQSNGGKLKALGVTSASRTPLAPEIPAVAEEIPGYEIVLWYGIVAPAGTPREAIKRLYLAIGAVMEKSDFKARFATWGVDPAPLGPEQFAGYIKSEIAKWSRDIRQAGIQPE
jgi:tripartite-type tricarboxylate transporter receptor subunit TctC